MKYHYLPIDRAVVLTTNSAHEIIQVTIISTSLQKLLYYIIFIILYYIHLTGNFTLNILLCVHYAVRDTVLIALGVSLLALVFMISFVVYVYR